MIRPVPASPWLRVFTALLFAFSHFGRLDKTIEGETGPRDLVRIARLLSHTFFGFAMGALYVERVGVAPGVGWLVTQLIILAVVQARHATGILTCMQTN